jgi:ATP synthase protein I
MDQLETLNKKLSEYEKKHNKETPNAQKPREGALFIAAELIAGVAIGTLIGFYLDQFLHTKVLFLLIFVILGLISSLYNIYKKYK